MQTDADSAKRTAAYTLIMVWISMPTDNRTSGWQTDHDRMDEIMGCLCDTELQDWQGMMTFPRELEIKRKPYLAESGERTGKLLSESMLL